MEALWRRELQAGMSAAMRCQLELQLQQLLAGQRVESPGEIFPNGVAKRVYITQHLYWLPDGNPAMLAELLVEPPAEKLMQAASHSSLPLILFNLEGEKISVNASFRALIGDSVSSLQNLIQDGTPLLEKLKELSVLSQQNSETGLMTVRGRRWFRTEHERFMEWSSPWFWQRSTM